MQAVKKESVYVGYGVRMGMKDGRLRITVPCSKRWRGSLFFILYGSFVVGTNGYLFLPGLLAHWLSVVRAGEILSSFFWLPLAIMGFWLAAAALVVYGLLWFLLGQYVLEIGHKNIRAGRSLLGIDFLGTHDTVGLRRIRFSPSLNLEGAQPYAFRTRWNRHNGKLFRPGRYTLHLDFGLKLREVLRLAIEESQVRTIKRLIREQCPHLYQDSLKSERASHFNDQIMDSLYLKGKVK